MRYGMKLGVGMALSVTMFGGDLATGSFVPAAASARDYYRGGHHGGHHYRGRGHHRGGGFGVGDALLGAVIIGGAAAIISSANRAPAYDGYTTYRAYPPAPAYAPPAGYDGPGDVYGDTENYDDGRAPEFASTDPVEQCSRAAEREVQSRRGGYARVLGIDRVDNRANGARVTGTVEVNGGDARGGSAARGDRAKFDCTADYGQVTGLRVG